VLEEMAVTTVVFFFFPSLKPLEKSSRSKGMLAWPCPSRSPLCRRGKGEGPLPRYKDFTNDDDDTLVDERKQGAVATVRPFVLPLQVAFTRRKSGYYNCLWR